MLTARIRPYYHLLRRARTCSSVACRQLQFTGHFSSAGRIQRREVLRRPYPLKNVSQNTDGQTCTCDSVTVSQFTAVFLALHNLNRAECSGMQDRQIRNFADAGPFGSPRVA